MTCERQPFAGDVLDLALHALAHLAAQRLEAAVLHAEGAHELGVHLGQALCLHFLDGEMRLGRTAGELGRAGIGRQKHVDGASVADIQAFHRLVEFRRRSALADDEADVFIILVGLVAAHFGMHVIVDRDPVGVLRGTLDFGEDGALLAHALHHGIHVRVGDAAHRLLERDAIERLDLHLGQHLEDCGVLEVCAAIGGQRLDAGAPGRAELFLSDGLGERAAHEIAQHLRANLLAELLLDDLQRRLAGPEALEPRGARDFLEALLDLAVDALGRDGNFQPSLETAGRGQ